MIGPHEGKELELMLAGEKSLAVFHDIVPADGLIPEEIIPEQAFAPYVAAGRVVRIVRDIRNVTSDDINRYVCFVLPGEEWRAEMFLWVREGIRADKFPYDDACDTIIGRLLGYTEDDIQKFTNQF